MSISFQLKRKVELKPSPFSSPKWISNDSSLTPVPSSNNDPDQPHQQPSSIQSKTEVETKKQSSIIKYNHILNPLSNQTSLKISTHHKHNQSSSSQPHTNHSTPLTNLNASAIKFHPNDPRTSSTYFSSGKKKKKLLTKYYPVYFQNDDSSILKSKKPCIKIITKSYVSESDVRSHFAKYGVIESCVFVDGNWVLKYCGIDPYNCVQKAMVDKHQFRIDGSFVSLEILIADGNNTNMTDIQYNVNSLKSSQGKDEWEWNYGSNKSNQSSIDKPKLGSSSQTSSDKPKFTSFSYDKPLPVSSDWDWDTKEPGHRHSSRDSYSRNNSTDKYDKRHSYHPSSSSYDKYEDKYDKKYHYDKKYDSSHRKSYKDESDSTDSSHPYSHHSHSRYHKSHKHANESHSEVSETESQRTQSRYKYPSREESVSSSHHQQGRDPRLSISRERTESTTHNIHESITPLQLYLNSISLFKTRMRKVLVKDIETKIIIPIVDEFIKDIQFELNKIEDDDYGFDEQEFYRVPVVQTLRVLPSFKKKKVVEKVVEKLDVKRDFKNDKKELRGHLIDEPIVNDMVFNVNDSIPQESEHVIHEGFIPIQEDAIQLNIDSIPNGMIIDESEDEIFLNDLKSMSRDHSYIDLTQIQTIQEDIKLINKIVPVFETQIKPNKPTKPKNSLKSSVLQHLPIEPIKRGRKKNSDVEPVEPIEVIEPEKERKTKSRFLNFEITNDEEYENESIDWTKVYEPLYKYEYETINRFIQSRKKNDYKVDEIELNLEHEKLISLLNDCDSEDYEFIDGFFQREQCVRYDKRMIRRDEMKHVNNQGSIIVAYDYESTNESSDSEERTRRSQFRKHYTGCARTEGYYRVSEQDKHKYVEKQKDLVGNKTGMVSLRTTRVNLRNLATGLENQKRTFMSGIIQESDVFKFNQLKTRKKRLKFGKSKIHDWGLFAMEKIDGHDMVIEYIGEIIRQKVADYRERRYEKMGIGSSYLFRIDDDLVNDATKRGNLARFINHCCDPNCNAKIITIEGVKRIVIYAKRDIEEGEEITYDYKFPLEDKKIPCLCGASSCRGFLN